MKAGISLQELAIEISQQNAAKVDYLVNTESMEFGTEGTQVYLQLFDNEKIPLEPLTVNSIAHQQLGTFTEIPAAYYNKMLTEHPNLLVQNALAVPYRVRTIRWSAFLCIHSLRFCTKRLGCSASILL